MAAKCRKPLGSLGMHLQKVEASASCWQFGQGTGLGQVGHLSSRAQGDFTKPSSGRAHRVWPENPELLQCVSYENSASVDVDVVLFAVQYPPTIACWRLFLRQRMRQ